jgi:hypothetical protein
MFGVKRCRRHSSPPFRQTSRRLGGCEGGTGRATSQKSGNRAAWRGGSSALLPPDIPNLRPGRCRCHVGGGWGYPCDEGKGCPRRGWERWRAAAMFTGPCLKPSQKTLTADPCSPGWKCDTNTFLPELRTQSARKGKGRSRRALRGDGCAGDGETLRLGDWETGRLGDGETGLCCGSPDLPGCCATRSRSGGWKSALQIWLPQP